ncbi:MAG: amidohydrolase [Anaerolineales bacterium]|nr:amidohydrolase [Anaerolineales bacterium]
MVIDTHAHVLGRLHGRVGRGRTRGVGYGRAQIGGGEAFSHVPPFRRATTFPPEVLVAQMDGAGVDKAVLLQGSFHGESNAYVAAAVARYPNRLIGAAFVDPRAPDAQAQFARLTGPGGFGVLKLEISVGWGFTGLYPDFRLDEPGLAWLWPAAEQQGVIVVLDLGSVGSASYQTEIVSGIVSRHPRLQVVIAHLAQPPLAAPDDASLNAQWEAQIALGRHANVWFDLAALPAYVDEDYPYPTARRYIARAGELIGTERLMWATDAPGLLGQGTYLQLLRYISRYCDCLTPEARAGVLGGNAWRLFGPVFGRNGA